MLATRKITAHIPEPLLRKAQAATGKGITETVKEGLHMLASAKAAEKLRELRGKVPLDVDLESLRLDRR